MNLRTLLIELTILISGCLARIDPDSLNVDTHTTIQFLEAQITLNAGRPTSLAIIRIILESLTTYHLPAEVALGSFEEDEQIDIENKYNDLIAKINPAMNRAKTNSSITEDERKSLTIETIMRWTIGCHRMEDVEQELKNYVHQKSFIIMFQVSRIAPTDDSKRTSLLTAILSFGSFDMDRLCVCGAIMLSVFLEIPFIEHRNKDLMGNIQYMLDIPSMWTGFPVSDKLPRMIDYMENTVFPGTIMPAAASMQHFRQVMEDFYWEIQYFGQLSAAHDMYRAKFEILLKWGVRVWNRLFIGGPDARIGFRERYIGERSQLIRYQEYGEAGPSDQD